MGNLIILYRVVIIYKSLTGFKNFIPILDERTGQQEKVMAKFTDMKQHI